MEIFPLYFGIILVTYIITAIIRGINNSGWQNEGVNQNEFQGKNLSFFADSAEKVITVLGNGYLKNLLLNIGIRKGICVVSDRRVYFKGTAYYAKKTGWKRVKKEDIVDLSDVASTSTVYISHWPVLLTIPITIALVILGDISGHSVMYNEEMAFVLLTCSPAALFYYMLTRKNLFQITFAGGQIAFNTAWYSSKELENFQKLLRQAKDHSVKSTPVHQTAPHKETSTLSDELRKYAELLQNGYLTQDEFNAIKKAWFAKQGIALD